MDASNGYMWVERRLNRQTARPRTPRRPRLPLIATGIVVVLVGAIALAGRDRGDGTGTGTPAPSTASSSASAMVPSERGAAATAARYAATLGGESMFIPDARHAIVDSIADPEKRTELQSTLDADYTADFNKRIGLDSSGRPPQGRTFVSRTMPAGTTVKAYDGASATVDVWCSGLFGVTGKTSKAPVTTNWFTMTITLKWSANSWKLTELTQTEGPDPKAGKFGQAPPQ
ncbi:hypothetical protein [Streptomyces sp. NPDC058572]|uniref:hypothetical protein n=1 Tax=Streptomyces sp. NPDC058572 TaxID=3346546 RepID=UPI00365D7299